MTTTNINPLDRAIALRAQHASALALAQKQQREAEVSCQRLAGGLATLDIFIASLNETAPAATTAEATPDNTSAP